MLGVLQVVSGPDQGRSLALSNGARHPIGRGPEVRLKLEDPTVSRVHCIVTVEEGKAVVADAGSLSGTWVNDQRISEHELRPNDVIRVGDSEILFQWSDSDEQATIPWNPGRND